MFIPIRHVRERVVCLLSSLIRKHAKQPVLPRLGVPLRFLRLLNRRIQRLHQLRPTPETVHRAALDERLQHPLI